MSVLEKNDAAIYSQYVVFVWNNTKTQKNSGTRTCLVRFSRMGNNVFITDQKKDALKRVQSFVKEYIKVTGNTNCDMLDIAKWLATIKRLEVSRATYHKYKSCILQSIDDKPTRYEAREIMNVAPSWGRPKLKKRTSGKKAKKCSPKDFAALKQHCDKSKAIWGETALDWLLSGIATGLRPFEWLVTRYDEEKDMLIVRNKKLELTVPGYPETYRQVPLSHITQEERLAVFQTFEFIKDLSPEDYHKKKGCASTWLQRANKKIFPRRNTFICLSSGRHQFAANLKSSGLTPKQIAYLMGHVTDQRAYETYGPSRNGNGVDLNTSHISQEALDFIREKLAAKIDMRNHVDVNHNIQASE